jgi:hypothetical protein
MPGFNEDAGLNALQAHGVRLLPLRPGEKCPAIKAWQERATSEPTAFTRLTAARPNSNVGAVTGDAGLFVLDIDVKHGDGFAELRTLEDQFGTLPKTWRCRTPSGGAHLWFRAHGVEIGNRTNIVPSLDVRGKGGFVVTPPSQIAGKPYLWEVGPNDAQVAEAPAWLIELVTSPSRTTQSTPVPVTPHMFPAGYGEAALKSEAATIAGASPGTRNATLYKSAANLGELIASGVVDECVVTEALLSACDENDLIADDGLATVQATISSGLKRGAQHPRQPRDLSATIAAQSLDQYMPRETEGTAHPRPGAERPRRGFQSAWADEIVLEPQDWLVKGLLPRRGIGFVYGPSGSGKSFYMVDLSMRIACSQPVHDRRTLKSGVIYVAAEADTSVDKRIIAWRQENGVEGVPVVRLRGAPTLGSRITSRGSERGMDELIAEIEAARPDMHEKGVEIGLIVIDTIAASIPGLDENAAGDAGALTSDLKELSERFDCLALGVHHSGVTTNERPRGSSAFYANSDVIVQVLRDEQKLRTVTFQKLRDAEDGAQFAFVLHDVQIGVDEDGDTVGAAICEFVPPAAGTRERGARLNERQQLILRAVNLCLDEGKGLLVPPLPGVRPAEIGLKLETLRKRALEIGFCADLDNPASSRKAFSRAIEQLITARRMRCEGDLIWSISTEG